MIQDGLYVPPNLLTGDNLNPEKKAEAHWLKIAKGSVVPRFYKKVKVKKKTRSKKPKEGRKALKANLGDPIEISPYDWEHFAREKQKIPPGDWTVWLLMAGRGFGKTRTGAETVRWWIEKEVCGRVALVAETEDEARTVMIEGPSGILNVCPPENRPVYTLSHRELIWASGARATIYTSETYEKLRGPQFDGAWVDELAKFRYAQQMWDQLMFSLRLGVHPRVIITTTPRPIALLEKLIKEPYTIVTQGTTYENRENLSPLFINQILKIYEGTRLGAQEIHAQLLMERQGALWTRDIIRYGVPL